jgi:hypothetical protein
LVVVWAAEESGSAERYAMGLLAPCLEMLVALAGEAEEEVSSGVVAPMMTTAFLSLAVVVT